MVANCAVQIIKVIEFHFCKCKKILLFTTVFPNESSYIINLLTVFVRFIIVRGDQQHFVQQCKDFTTCHSAHKEIFASL